MKIKRRIRNALLMVSIAAIALIMLVSLFGLFSLRGNLSAQMSRTSQMISAGNSKDMLSMSIHLAESTARLNASKISGDFSRIKGELLTLKGDIENLYAGGGIISSVTAVERYQEYIISQRASLSRKEIDKNVARLAGASAMFDNVLAHEDKISLAYIVLENGMVFSSADTFYPEVEKADMRTRDWYRNAVAAGDICWSELYAGTDGRNYVTVAIPVYYGGQEFGVVAFDLRVSEISEVVLNKTDASFTDAFIIGTDKKVLLSTEDVNVTTRSEEYRAVSEQVDFSAGAYGCYQGDNIIAGYAQIGETGWILVNCLDYNQVVEPVRKVEATVDMSSETMQDVMSRQIFSIIAIFVLCLALIFAAVLFVSQKLAGKITEPVDILAAGARELGGGNLNHVIPNLGGDELGMLAQSFNSMSLRMREYIENLTAVTIEKERIGAELDVARHIQASMLPCIFPAFPERPELDIYATMIPAKEVGGDFYDFFLVDDDRLAMVMADVSGKGVPAALFMVIAKTLLKNVTQTGLSPKAVLEKVNNQLCVNNEAEMFVTVWLGILEISTGRLTCANAGHEYPVVKRAGGSYELIKDRHGFVLAGMEGSHYKEYELQMEPGDRLFLYTDGVAEATDAYNELYGTARMLDALNRNKDVGCEALLRCMKEEIDAFAGEAPQFDDITMLCVERMPQNGPGMNKLKLRPTMESIGQVTAFVEQELETADIPGKSLPQMIIAVDEIFSNIARYSGATDATVGVSVEDGLVILRFADNGLPYDPTKKPDPDTTLNAGERDAGGLGIFMVKKLMDTVAYEYQNGLNLLTLTKNWK